MYTSELARYQNRAAFLRYNLDLCCVFGAVNTPVHNHVKPSNDVWSPLTIGIRKSPRAIFIVKKARTKKSAYESVL